MSVQRVQIPVSFQYSTTAYVAASSGGSPTTALKVFSPVVGSTVTVVDRNTGNPTTVYADSSSGTVLASIVTDAGGNVPGWVVEGSYAITAAPVSGFAGATENWDAVRGDGVENLYAGSVTTAALSSAVSQQLVPVGTVLPFAGAAAPAGFVLCDGSAQTRTGTYAALFAVVGTTYGAGNGTTTFNLPDLRSRLLIGAGTGQGLTNRVLGTPGGSESHTHSIPALSIPSLTVNGHTHGLGSGGGAQITPGNSAGSPYMDWTTTAGPNYTAFREEIWTAGSNSSFGAVSLTAASIPLVGNTNSAGATTASSSTGGGTSGTPSAMLPYLPLNHIIKY